MAQRVESMPAVWKTQLRSLCWEDLLEKKMAIQSSILAWRIPWTEEPGEFPWGCKKKSDMTELLTHTAHCKCKVLSTQA